VADSGTEVISDTSSCDEVSPGRNGPEVAMIVVLFGVVGACRPTVWMGVEKNTAQRFVIRRPVLDARDYIVGYSADKREA
jgi:hypothetical protein